VYKTRGVSKVHSDHASLLQSPRLATGLQQQSNVKMDLLEI